ncbi:MAG TPA: amidase, partial [Candidatus Saccharimonadales bacterium]|nr:amidase [Candidatus Saccharimonadales bacterium]
MSDLNKLSIYQALDGLKKNEFTATELTQACLDAIDKQDPQIKSYLLVNKEQALAQAKKADELIAAQCGKAFYSKPLLGIPYACKDNFNTYGIETTASSNVLKGYIPPYESTVTKKLADAGAVLLGKTNMDAFAHGSSTETSDFGPTHNPHDLKKSPGGSSGGSSAAVAADMCIFAMGSETAGSVRGPAAWCGVVGLKPTYGRVSRYGVIAMASSTDSPGPITKTVEDAALILQIIAGKDAFDATSSPKPVENYLPIKTDLKGIKIGKPKSYFEIDLEPGVKEQVEKAVAKFK